MARTLHQTNKLKQKSAIFLFLGAAALGMSFLPGSSHAQDRVYEAETTTLEPDPKSVLWVPASPRSAEELELLITRQREIREAAATATVISPDGPPTEPPVVGTPTRVVDNETRVADPGALAIYRNRLNPPTLAQSTLAEPSAINNGTHVLAVGNFSHREYSTSRGLNWTKSVFPGGPASAPIPCCDGDVIHDKGRGVTFLSTLYINSSVTYGLVRIYVYRNINTAPNCSYTISAGAGILPDYPHLGKSNMFLYLTLNNIGPGAQAQVQRYNIDQMADCAGASGSIANLNDRATVGQRIVTPADGATTTQYFSWAENTTQIRIFSWPDDSGSPTSVLRTIGTSSFSNPDCRGGILNNDFTDGLWASIHGFNRRGAVGQGRVYFYWTVGSDGSHPHGHVHSAIFNQSDLSILTETPMWFSDRCNGMPNIATNDRGDLGISTVAGGKTGGLGDAAKGYVGISDDYSGGAIGFFPTVYLTANGNYNRTDERFGDYFGIHRSNPCGNNWTAMNYALRGGLDASDVNSRYVEFGRNRDAGCQHEEWTKTPRYQ